MQVVHIRSVCTCMFVCVCMVVGDGGTEAKLRLQEEHIFDLKQQMATMQQRIVELKYENEHLRSLHFPAPIKEEGGICVCRYTSVSFIL